MAADSDDSFDNFALMHSSSGEKTVGVVNPDSQDCSIFSDSYIKAEPLDEEYGRKAPEYQLEEMQERDFDPVSIEDVSLEVLANRIRRVFKEVTLRGLASANQLVEIASKIVYKSTLFEESATFNPVINAVCKGMTMVLLCTEERDEECQISEKNVIMFVAKLAVFSKSQGCENLLEKLFIIVEKFFYHPESLIRHRICNLINALLIESNIVREVEIENGDIAHLFDDVSIPEAEVIIPEGILEQWTRKLSNSVLDKSPNVRVSAVHALAQLDREKTFKDMDGDEITPNWLISRSMDDIDESVRCMAVKCVHIVDGRDIDKCLAFIENCTENKIRHLMVVRLASDVHLFSFSEQQRFRLINILLNSDSARMQDVIHQNLAESWMRVAAESIDSLSLFKYDSNDREINHLAYELLEGFPSIIFEYLDPITDPQATSILLKFATTRYVRLSTSKNTNLIDFECFLKNLADMSKTQCEELALMTRTSFRLLPKWESDESDDKELWLKKTFHRIFLTRHLLDVIFQLTAEKNSGESLMIRDRAMRFLCLGVGPLAKKVQKFCNAYFTNEEFLEKHGETCEVLFANLLHIIDIMIKENDDEFEKTVYGKMLETLLEDGSMIFSNEIVHIMLSIRLDLCGDETNIVRETCDWACYAANSLLMTDSDGNPIGDDLQIALENLEVRSCMMRRCAAMLLAICQHDKVERSSVLMITLFKSLLPALLSNNNDEVKFEGIELIGHSAVIDPENSGPYLKLVRLLMVKSNDEHLKAASINALVRVIKKRGFSKVAANIYELEEDNKEACANLMASLLVEEFKKMKGIALIQVVRDVVSMLSHEKLFWPEMLAMIMKTCFSNTFKEQLRKFFKKYCRVSVTSLSNRVHLMRGFLKCLRILEAEADMSKRTELMVGDLTAFICQHLSSVPIEEDHNNNIADSDSAFFVEAELARSFVEATIAEPYMCLIRHVFSTFATSLNLSSIPLSQLNTLRDRVIVACNLVGSQNSRISQQAVKRFLTSCEKTIALKTKMKRLENGGDIKQENVVVSESNDREVELITTPARKGIRKNDGNGDYHTPVKKSKKATESWDDDKDCFVCIDSEEDNNEVEYVPRTTRSQRSSQKRKPMDPPTLRRAKNSRIMDFVEIKKENEELEAMNLQE